MVCMREMMRGLMSLVLMMMVTGVCLADLALVTEVTPPVTTKIGTWSWTPEVGETLAEGTLLDVAAGGLLRLVHLKLSREILLNGPKSTELQIAGLKGIAEKDYGPSTARLAADLDLSARSQQQVGAIDAQTATTLGVGDSSDNFDSGLKKDAEGPGGSTNTTDSATEEKKTRTAAQDTARAQLELAKLAAAGATKAAQEPSKPADEVPMEPPGQVERGDMPKGAGVDPAPPPPAPAPAPVLPQAVNSAVPEVVPPAGPAAAPKPSSRGPEGLGSGFQKNKSLPEIDATLDGTVTALHAALALPSDAVMLKDGAVGLRPPSKNGKTILMEVVPSDLAGWTILGIPVGTTIDQAKMVPIKPNASKKARFAILKPQSKTTTPVLEALEAESKGLLAQAAGIWCRLMLEKTVGPAVAQAHLKRLAEKMHGAAGDL